MSAEIHDVIDRMRRWSYAHSGYHREVSKDIDLLIARLDESFVGTIRVVTGLGNSLPSAATSGALVLRGSGETIEDLAPGSVYIELIGGRHAESLIENQPAVPVAADALATVTAERDEALRKIKAAPHQFPQCFRFLCNEDDLTYPCTCWKQMP